MADLAAVSFSDLVATHDEMVQEAVIGLRHSEGAGARQEGMEIIEVRDLRQAIDLVLPVGG